MRRLYAWTAGLVGIAALARLLAARRARVEAPALQPPPEEPDPADELRRRLAESRDDEVAVEPAPPTESLDDRRARVHAKAQEALAAMDALEEPPT